MRSNVSSWLFLTLALALCTAANSCVPVIITETVYVTAPSPSPPGPSTSMANSSSSPFNSPLVSTPLAPPPASSVAYTAPAPSPAAPSPSAPSPSAPPPSAPPANGVTFTSAEKPQATAHSSLLCPQAEPQAQAAGSTVPPMPFGANLDASIATYDPLPTLAAAICQAPDHFHKVTTTPDHGSIKNSCNYEVYVDSVGCGNGAQHQLIPAGQTWSEPLRSCDGASVVYKVTKADSPSKPVQFEVGLSPQFEDVIWYDISFLDCMRPNTTDLSACPGWEGGVQCVPGGQGCQIYVCGPGEYCDGSAYTVPEFGLIKDGPYANEATRKSAGAPNSSCKTKEEGIAFEICATN